VSNQTGDASTGGDSISAASGSSSDAAVADGDAAVPAEPPSTDGSEADTGAIDGESLEADVNPVVANPDAGARDAAPDAPTDAATESDRDGQTEAGASTDAASEGGPTCGMDVPSGPAFEDIVRTCTLAVSCDPLFFGDNISGCIASDLLRSIGYYSCLATIQDCNGYYQCQGLRGTTPEDCPGTAAPVRCDEANNLAIDCNSELVENCTRFGGTCGAYTDGSNSLRVGCVVAPSCTETDGGAYCTADGHSVYDCFGGRGFGENCTLEDSTCASFTEGAASCYYDGPPCTQPGYACDGGVLTLCAKNTLRQTKMADCASAGLSCYALADGGLGTCVAPGCTSGFQNCPVESCGADGKTLTVCAGGTPYKIDCSTIGGGFTSCATITEPSTGVVFGLCF
jgi:hypothetical protein